jgi:hypothetical protein
MPYIYITFSPGIGLREHQIVQEALGDEPIDGMLLHVAGEADGGLHTVDIWDSAAAADRFAAERLFPAFERTGVRQGPDVTAVFFDGEISVNAWALGAVRPAS